MLENRIYSFLGLARKANKLAAGYESCERLLKAGKAELVIVAEDASQIQRKSLLMPAITEKWI